MLINGMGIMLSVGVFYAAQATETGAQSAPTSLIPIKINILIVYYSRNQGSI
ncbi:MAG: hypothetical protein ACI9RZ_002101 [Sphingobacteriales bacterium]|jgi:hypothetical protein